MPRPDSYAELIALCCAVCLLAMSRSNLQYGCNFQEKKKEDRERTIKGTKPTKYEYTRTYIPVSTGYRMIPGTTDACSKESTVQHGTTPQGKARHSTAPHGAALRCAALLNYIAGLS